MTTKPDFCRLCPINTVTQGYVPLKLGNGPAEGGELWIGEAAGGEEIEKGEPFVGGAGGWLNSLARASRVSRSRVNIINTIGCRPPKNEYPTSPQFPIIAQAETGHTVSQADGYAAVAYCAKHHLWPAIAKLKPSKIIAFGDQALRAVTNRQGVLTWRGSPLPLRGHVAEGPRVVPTLHPAYLMRNAGLFSVAAQDLRRSLRLPPENYNLWGGPKDVEEFRLQFAGQPISFDFEWDSYGNVSICGLSARTGSALVVDFNECKGVLRGLFECAVELIGHNIVGADTKFFEKWGWDVGARLTDTMLIQHLVQPDMKHDLGFVASVFSTKVFWKGRGEETEDEHTGEIRATGAQWKTWDSPDAIPREFGGYGGCASADEAYRLYNARDTDGTLQCAVPLNITLDKYALRYTYENVSVPAAFICRELGDTGLRIDNRRVVDIRKDIESEISRIQQTLPEGLAPYDKPIKRLVDAPPNTFKPKTKYCNGNKRRGFAKHLKTPIVFAEPGVVACVACGMPVESGELQQLKRIKVDSTLTIVPWNSADATKAYAANVGLAPYIHGRTGRSTADKNARKTWGRSNIEFAAVDALKKLSTQRSSFAKPKLVEVPRVYFNLLVHGTSEGRLSSSGRRRGIDPNIQNQPKSIRKIFVPDREDFGFLDSDIIQGENMITAWLAKDWPRWERLNTPGYDEHADMASAFFNCNVSKDNEFAHLRAPGKVINHGRNYGLGVKKTQEYLAVQGFFYSLADIKEMIEIWKGRNARTALWQQETIETAERQSYLENAFRRRRWFQGRDFATKALAFLPASTLADIVLRCMIGLYPERFKTQIVALGLGVTGQLPQGWFLNIQVHDSLVGQGPHTTRYDAADIFRMVMTQPWRELDNFCLGVEQQYSNVSWGDVKKLT